MLNVNEGFHLLLTWMLLILIIFSITQGRQNLPLITEHVNHGTIRLHAEDIQ